MISKMPYFFFHSLKIIKSDRKMFFIALCPIIIGFIFYYFMGSYAYAEVSAWGHALISEKFPDQGWMNTIFSSLAVIILAVLINWTFFLFISFIASPFNDMMSARVEVMYKLEKKDSDSFSETMKRVPSIIINEIKKIGVIVLLSVVNIALGFFFPPITFLIGGLILAISFIDYSWSRNDLKLSECIRDVRTGFFPYLIGGFCFMFLISIPILNLFFLPIAVVFFTVIYCEVKVSKGSSSEEVSS